MVWTFWTGVLVTFADFIEKVRGPPGSWTVKVWVSLGPAGDKPALSGLMLVWSLPLTMSAPSIASTLAPRARFAGGVAPGEPGSVNATRKSRGPFPAVHVGHPGRKIHSTPYPAVTPDCESWSHWAVGMMKWNRSFGLPEGL